MSWHCPECGDSLLDVHFNVRCHGPIWPDEEEMTPDVKSAGVEFDYQEDPDAEAIAFSCSTVECGWYGHHNGATEPEGASAVPYWVPDELARDYVKPDPFIKEVKLNAAA